MIATRLKDLFNTNQGATAIEYGLITTLIILSAMAALVLVGGNLDDMFLSIKEAISLSEDAPQNPWDNPEYDGGDNSCGDLPPAAGGCGTAD